MIATAAHIRFSPLSILFSFSMIDAPGFSLTYRGNHSVLEGKKCLSRPAGGAWLGMSISGKGKGGPSLRQGPLCVRLSPYPQALSPPAAASPGREAEPQQKRSECAYEIISQALPTSPIRHPTPSPPPIWLCKPTHTLSAPPVPWLSSLPWDSRNSAQGQGSGWEWHPGNTAAGSYTTAVSKWWEQRDSLLVLRDVSSVTLS